MSTIIIFGLYFSELSLGFALLMLILTLIWLYLVNQYYKFLENNHPEVYKVLGEPKIASMPGLSREINFFRHVLFDAIAQSDNEEVNRKRKDLRVLFICQLSVFVVLCSVLLSSTPNIYPF